MPAPPVGGADAVDMGGGGCTMAGGAAALGLPPSGAVRGSAFSCSTSSGAAPGGTLVGTVAGAGGDCPWCWGLLCVVVVVVVVVCWVCVCVLLLLCVCVLCVSCVWLCVVVVCVCLCVHLCCWVRVCVLVCACVRAGAGPRL